MDLSAKHSDGHRDDHDEDAVGIYSVEDEVVEDDDYDDDVDGDETKSLFPAGENGMLRSFDKGARKVQWNDSIGNNLAEVLEFMPRFRLIVGALVLNVKCWRFSSMVMEDPASFVFFSCLNLMFRGHRMLSAYIWHVVMFIFPAFIEMVERKQKECL